LVEAEPTLQTLLQHILEEEGYRTTVAASVQQALHLVHRQPCELVLLDLFAPTPQEAFALLRPLRQLSHHLPLVVLTDMPIREQDVQQQECMALLRKPVRLEDLITTVAACLNQPWSPEHRQQAAVLERLVAALARGDFEAALAVCQEEVQWYPWLVPAYPAMRAVTGRAALRALLKEMRPFFRDLCLEVVHLYPCPHGIAARLLVRWRTAEGTCQQQMVCWCVQVSGKQISRVGIPRPPDEQLAALLGSL
jgi:CheY-like chemotaxis protein